MGQFFKKLRQRLGKGNPAWQQSAYYYDLYHHLPIALTDPRTFRGVVIFFLSFIVGAIVLFVYSLVSVLTSSSVDKNADYFTVLIAFPVFIILLALAFFFIVRYNLKQRRKWKSYENDWVRTNGEVIGKWWENSVGVDSAGGTDYYIAIQYNKYFKLKSPVTLKSFYKTKIGDPVMVRYVNIKPEVCEVLKV